MSVTEHRYRPGRISFFVKNKTERREEKRGEKEKRRGRDVLRTRLFIYIYMLLFFFLKLLRSYVTSLGSRIFAILVDRPTWGQDRFAVLSSARCARPIAIRLGAHMCAPSPVKKGKKEVEKDLITSQRSKIGAANRLEEKKEDTREEGTISIVPLSLSERGIGESGAFTLHRTSDWFTRGVMNGRALAVRAEFIYLFLN